MATFVNPSVAVTSGEPVAIGDIASYGTVSISDPRSVREVSAYGDAGNNFNDNTIDTVVPPTVKHMVVFKSIAGNVHREWHFASAADATAELALIDAQLNPGP